MFIKDNTERGFAIIQFLDRYKKRCYIQKSSLPFEDCLWFGIADPEPKIMVNDAEKLGLPITEDQKQNRGWMPYEGIPKEVLLTTTMHLTQDEVKALIPILQNFVNTGEVKL